MSEKAADSIPAKVETSERRGLFSKLRRIFAAIFLRHRNKEITARQTLQAIAQTKEPNPNPAVEQNLHREKHVPRRIHPPKTKQITLGSDSQPASGEVSDSAKTDEHSNIDEMFASVVRAAREKGSIPDVQSEQRLPDSTELPSEAADQPLLRTLSTESKGHPSRATIFNRTQTVSAVGDSRG